MEKCGLKNIELWGGIPHYCRLNYGTSTEAFRKIGEMRRKMEDKRITLVIEQLQPYESNLLISCPDMKRMLDEVHSPALRTCVNLVAMEVIEEPLEQYYDALGAENIRHIHYADGNPSGHFILGDGNLPLRKYVKILESHDYDRYLTLEINDSIYWDDPHTSIKRSADYLREFLPDR